MNSATLYVGDAIETLQQLPAGHARTCVCSPPYWGLRDYGVDGQLGLEETPDEYVSRLVEVFREVRRVLAEDGTLWLNLGDTYNSNASNQQNGGIDSDYKAEAHRSQGRRKKRVDDGTLKQKDLVGIPWRVALALQRDGWWLRSDIIWHKPNPMPESVTDRPTSSHEHIFLLSKSKRYYYDDEAIREDAPERKGRSGSFVRDNPKGSDGTQPGKSCASHRQDRDDTAYGGSRNKRDVWTVSTKPYPEAHFAVYPPDLIRPCIEAGTSQKGQCPKCGAPWERVTDEEKIPNRPGRVQNRNGDTLDEAHGPDGRSGSRHAVAVKTKGWRPTCNCDADDPEPEVVLDPFAGAGTTGLVALARGRDFTGIDLNREYVEMAADRIRQDAPLVNSVDVKSM